MMVKAINIYLIFLILASSVIFAEMKDDIQKIKEFDMIDFKSIKKILKQDGLEEEAVKKTKDIKETKKKVVQTKRKLYDIPGDDFFWSFASEYWLIKMAPILKWNFKSPDFDLDKSFKHFLEKIGFFDVKFKILLLDTPSVTHFSLPSNKDEFIFLLSLPFFRTLDLTKQEISLLLLEDYIRAQKGYFKEFVKKGLPKKFLGQNLKEVNFSKESMNKILKKYDQKILKDGFSFKEQFHVTQELDRYLKNDKKLHSAYLSLLQKIDDLVSTNILYKNYPQIYRSPQLQKNWIYSKK